MLKIYTSHISIKDSDAYDITVKSGDPVFAPTWDMVTMYKKGLMSEHTYSDFYKCLMVVSYKRYYDKWDYILGLDRIVFTCYCNLSKNPFCHRLLLPIYFENLGAKYEGELSINGDTNSLY
jgi:hypothetical protein